MTKGRDWYPVLFAELERIGAVKAGIGIREVDDGEGISIEFINDTAAGGGQWIIDIEEAPLFLDAFSAGEASTIEGFDNMFASYFGLDDDEETADEETE